MYRVKFSEGALKQMRKLDKQTARVIKNWIVKNLVDTTDPRIHGKGSIWVDMKKPDGMPLA